MRRYGIRDIQWERIRDLLPGQKGVSELTAADNFRVFVEAVYRYRTGMPWRDLPERFGDWKKHASTLQQMGEIWCMGEGLASSADADKSKIQ